MPVQGVTSKNPTKLRHANRPRPAKKVRTKRRGSILDRAWSRASAADRRALLARLIDGARDTIPYLLGRIEQIGTSGTTNRRPEDTEPPPEIDHFAKFLQSCLSRAPSSRLESAFTHRLYERYSEANDASPLSSIMFSKEMKRRGFKKHKSNTMFWIGVRARGPLQPSSSVIAVPQ